MEKFRGKYRILSSRWEKWDYGLNAAYYVTICTHHHICFFGDVIIEPEKTMQYNELGLIARQYWAEIPDHFPFVELDAFVIMPNHVHGIVVINKSNDGCNHVGLDSDVETQDFASLNALQNLHALPKQNPNHFEPQSKNLGSIIRGYKSGVKKYATMHKIDFSWQSLFYDRVIRDYHEYTSIRDYIQQNVENWNGDQYSNHYATICRTTNT